MEFHYKNRKLYNRPSYTAIDTAFLYRDRCERQWKTGNIPKTNNSVFKYDTEYAPLERTRYFSYDNFTHFLLNVTSLSGRR